MSSHLIMKKIALIAVSLVLFLSCRKQVGGPSPNCTPSMATIAGNYKITAVSYKATPTSPEEDYLDEFLAETCQRDNLYTFKTDGTYQLSDAGVVCSPPENDNGTWNLEGTTNLQIDGEPTILESFDCKIWVVANTDLLVTGDKLKLTLTRQ
jgi:hypothetical protein